MAISVAFPAGSLRGKLAVPVGDGGNRDLLVAMRRQANFIEWVPLLLVLLALLEMNGVGKVPMHVMGASLIVFRACHAFGLRGDTMRNPGRFIGAMGTMLLTAVASVWLIVRFLG
jgi:uncharacterized membrane protein YecN with MAPEG domain